MIKKKISVLVAFFLAGTFLFLGFYFVRAFTGPQLPPPGGSGAVGVDAAGQNISVGGTAQGNTRLYIQGNTYGVRIVQSDNDPVLVADTTNQRVGVAAAAPGYTLDVNGPMRLSPVAQPTGAEGVTYYDATSHKFRCFEGNPAAWKDCDLAGGGASAGGDPFKWIISGTTMYATTTPINAVAIAKPLTVGTSTSFGFTPGPEISVIQETSNDDAIVLIRQIHPTLYGAAGIGIQTPEGSWHIAMEQQTAGFLGSGAIGFLWNSSNYHMVIESGGRVGIGVTRPSSTLHVAGAAAYIQLEPRSASGFNLIANAVCGSVSDVGRMLIATETTTYTSRFYVCVRVAAGSNSTSFGWRNTPLVP